MIVLDWVTEHFLDFESNDEMNDFLDWFEEMLIEEVGVSGQERVVVGWFLLEIFVVKHFLFC